MRWVDLASHRPVASAVPDIVRRGLAVDSTPQLTADRFKFYLQLYTAVQASIGVLILPSSNNMRTKLNW